MKITQITIKDFHQFKDLTIDLTYPKGHAKEGQPLDKVCFIGQSGTGKTSLLELIPKFLYNYNTPLISKCDMECIYENLKFTVVFGEKSEYKWDVFFDMGNDLVLSEFTVQNFTNNNEICDYDAIWKYYHQEWLKKNATKLIYFHANLNYDIEVGSKNNINEKEIIDFSVDKVSVVWNLILEQIQKYQEQELQIRQEISKTVEQASNNLDVIKKALKKLEDWKKTEFNPIQDIADNCLNKLLEPYKLRVKTELDIKSKEDIGFIKIEDYAGNEIPHGLWSTGTKQIILSALPLYLLKPKHTVILFDEPERSLYPDMQHFIVDYYTGMTENCQFFYSTHSPIIASNFEPWEIVELKFDKEGHVYRELYFEGENHVDNYKWDPRYMRWDDILQRIFDMENDGSDDRKKKLNALARLNVKYQKLKDKNKADTDEAKTILEEISTLQRLLSWPTNYAEN